MNKKTIKHAVFIAMLLLVSQAVHAQGTLSKQLWGQVQSCNSEVEIGSNGKPQYDELVDDSKNGYLKIASTGAPSGCFCRNTIGAYRNSSNKYVFLKKYFWYCSWKKGLQLNDSFSKIFPFDFEVDGFFQKKINNTDYTAYFYLDFVIPRKGTDTKVFIKPIPLGLKVKSKKNVVFAYAEDGRRSNEDRHELAEAGRAISALNANEEKIIKNLLNKNTKDITKKDKKVIAGIMGSEYSDEKNIRTLQKMKHIYNLYTQIKYESLVLGWNREHGSFYVKEKKIRTKVDSFVEFFKHIKKWDFMS